MEILAAIESIQDFIEMLDGVSNLGIYSCAFLFLILAGAGVPVPEDLTIIACGFLAFHERLNLWVVIAVCVPGTVIGDSVMYAYGRFIGANLTQHRWLKRLVSEKQLDRSEELVTRHGALALIAVRFLPGFRGPTYFTCGTMKFSYLKFWVLDGLAALVSVPLWIWLVYRFGEQIEANFKRWQGWLAILLIGLAAAIVLRLFYVRFKRVRRSRELNRLREQRETERQSSADQPTG